MSPKNTHVPRAVSKKSKNHEPTNMDILQAINDFATHVEHRFQRLENRIAKVEATMVTKDYLDQRLFDLKTDTMTVVRREDQRFTTLVDVLYNRKILTSQDVEHVMSIEPSAKIS